MLLIHTFREGSDKDRPRQHGDEHTYIPLVFRDGENFWQWFRLEIRLNTFRLSIQGFGREKDVNRGKFIGSNLVIFCYKEFEKFAPCKSVSQSEATLFILSQSKTVI